MDLIDRQAAIDCIRSMEEWRTGDAFNVDRVIRHIKDLPSVTPQPKIGHWINKDGQEHGFDIGGVKTWYIQIMCSECGFIKTAIEGHTGQYHYCPNCGAKIQEVEE